MAVKPSLSCQRCSESYLKDRGYTYQRFCKKVKKFCGYGRGEVRGCKDGKPIEEGELA